MRAGSYDLHKPTADIYGPITKDLAFRAVGTYEKSNSFRDVVKSSRRYVNPSLLYRPGKKTTILLQGDYSDADLTPDNGIGILNQNIDPVISAFPDPVHQYFLGLLSSETIFRFFKYRPRLYGCLENKFYRRSTRHPCQFLRYQCAHNSGRQRRLGPCFKPYKNGRG